MDSDMAAADGWNDDEIIIDEEENGPRLEVNNQETNSLKDDSQSKYETELEFFDNLAKDSSRSVGSASREDQNQFDPSAEKSQGYDAVGSLFSYLQSSVRTVAESAVTKQMVQNYQQVPNISASATYLRQATSTLIGGQSVDAKQIDGRPSAASSSSLPSPEPFTDIDYPPSWQVADMDKQVMEHLVRENRQLKAALTKATKPSSIQSDQNHTSSTADEKDQIIRKMQAEIDLLKQGQKVQKEKDLDPKKEFDEIKSLFSLHRVDFEQEDIVKLYSSAYFSQDKLQINQLKVKLFQSLTERAIKSQEILLKTTARKGKKGGAKPSEAQIYMENKQLIQQNTGLKGSVEQLTKSLQIAEEKSQLKNQKIQRLVSCLKNVQEQVSTLRNQQMMLRTFQQDLSHTLQSSYLFSPLMEKIKKHAASFDNELETSRKAVFEKNNKINEQFMRQREMSEEFEEQIKQTKAELQRENEEQLQNIVMTKNKEIGRLFTENREVSERAQGLEANMQEQMEQMELVTEENQALKKQIQEQLMQGIGKLDQDAKMTALKKANEEMKQQIEQLSLENQDVHERLMSKDADVMQLQSDIDQRNKEFQQIEEEIDHYQIELDEKRDEIDCLKQQNDKLKQLSQQAPASHAPAVVDHTERNKQYMELKAEYDQLKALYDVASIGVTNQGSLPVQDTTVQNNAIESSVMRSFPDIPLLNFAKNEPAAGASNVKEKNVAKDPQIVNAWDDEIDLDEELLGLDNVDGSAATIGQGLISTTEVNIINKKEEVPSPNLQLPQVKKESSSEHKVSHQSSSQKSALGEDDDADFKHMRTALNTDHLTMIMKQIDAPQGESQQVEQYFRRLKRDKRKEAKRIQLELDMFLFDQQSEEVASPASLEEHPKQRHSKTVVEDKASISNVKAKAYPAIEVPNEKNNEVDEFLLYQENNDIPQVKFIEEDGMEDNNSDSIKPRIAGGSRDPRRQPSFSMPSSPQGAPNPVAGDLEGDDDGIRLITIDSGRKSLHVQGKETQSEDEMQYKGSRSDTYEGILLDLPTRPKDLDKVEGSTSQNGVTNPSAMKSQEKQLHLEKLMSEKLEEIPTPAQRSKTKEIKDGPRLDEDGLLKIQNDMDNDFSSSRFPDSVKNPVIQQESQFNFQQDQLLEGLASNDDSLLHQNSGGDEDLQKLMDSNDPNGKQRTTSHQASNSLHQRNAEIINEADIQFERMNSAEKPQLSASPLNQSPTNEQQQKPNFRALNVGPVPSTSAPTLKAKITTGKRQPFTPDSKSKPFTAQIGEVTLNTAVLGNQKQPNEGPEQILSDLDEDIMPDETSPQKLGQASPASKGIDSSGPVQPDIEVIVEADECEEDLDDDQSKQHNDPRISMPSSQKSKKSMMTGKNHYPQALQSAGTGARPAQQSPDSSPFAPAPEVVLLQANSAGPTKQSEEASSPGLTSKTRSLPKKLDLEIDIEEAENGERIEFKRQVEAVQGQIEYQAPANNANNPNEAKAPVIVDKIAEQPHRSKADDEEEETDNYSQNYRVTPSDDAPMSRIELTDHEYQNIIQYSEVISKGTSGISKQKSNNDPEGKLAEQRQIPVEKLVSYQMDATSQYHDPQDDQLNQIQTDITRKEKEEKAQNYAASRQPITAREQIMNPLNKVSGPGIRTASGNYNSNVHINPTISSLQSINSDDKTDMRPKKGKGGMLTSHGHSQSQQIKMPENKNASDIQFLNVNKSPIHSKRDDFGKKATGGNQIIEAYGHDEVGKNVNINYGIFSESLEEVDDQYKESEFYSPLKQSKNDMTSMTSSVANSTFGASPSRLQQTMNKLIQMKILEEANQQRGGNGPEFQEGIFSEIEAESQLSSMVGASPKALDPSKQIQGPAKFPTMPKLNLEQAKLLEQEQSRENMDSSHPMFSATDTPSATAADASNTPVFKKQNIPSVESPDHQTQGDQSVTALMKSVTSEMEKNQEVVNKIDQVQKKIREQRESLLNEENAQNEKMEDGEKMEPRDDQEVYEEEQEIKEDEVSLDLADLEDLNNDTFAELTHQNQKQSSETSVTPEKKVADLVEALAQSGDKPKAEASLSILDFLSEEVSPPKKQPDFLVPPQSTSTTTKPSPLDELGILGDSLGTQLVPKAEPPSLDELGILGKTGSLNQGIEKTASNTGWDDEDMIEDDLLNDMNLEE